MGLTGPVSFDENGDREGIYDIVNLRNVGNTTTFQPVGLWSVKSNFNLSTPIVWYDGSTNVPADSKVPTKYP